METLGFQTWRKLTGPVVSAKTFALRYLEEANKNTVNVGNLRKIIFSFFSLLKFQQSFDLFVGHTNLALKTRFNKCCCRFKVNKFSVHDSRFSKYLGKLRKFVVFLVSNFSIRKNRVVEKKLSWGDFFQQSGDQLFVYSLFEIWFLSEWKD